MPQSTQAGDVLAGRYRLDDLLTETRGGRFWRAHDQVLHRPVAVHLLPHDDPRADSVVEAARNMGPLADRRILRVLDADNTDQICFVVLEWGQGESLDHLLEREGPLPARRAAWLVGEVADSIADAHDAGLAHGRLVPENVLVDHHGNVRIIGFAIECALAGLPQGRVSTDVVDLAALLYFALTGKWPGVSRSGVPAAPLTHGQVLRPRQVRAGIPRQLDVLCDEVLNSDSSRPYRGPHDLSTARGIATLLAEFVGDPTGMMGPVPGIARPPATPVVVEPEPAADPPADPPTEAIPSASPPVSPPASPPASPPGPIPPRTRPVDLPTEAGMPVFHDDDDVEWLRARSEPAAPPPPLEEAPPKPLFAPDPPEGQPVRRPRPGSAAAAAAEATAASGRDDEYWPWGGSTGTGHSPVHSSTDGWGSDPWNTGNGTGTWGTGESVPGRSWFRLALIVGLSALVLLTAVAAYQLGLGQDDGETPPPSTPTETSQGAPTPFADVTARDFDPQGSPPQDEYPELVPLAIDGDLATEWHTANYKQNFGPGGLKNGVGLVLDLGATRDVRSVAITVRGTTRVATYVTDEDPTGVEGMEVAGEAAGNGELVITYDEPVSGRYVTVWLTSLPRVEGGFRGAIAEVQVLG